jgi:hypothetical protein
MYFSIILFKKYHRSDTGTEIGISRNNNKKKKRIKKKKEKE